ncbi:MAG: hypothetical protein ACRC28_17070 [Clostridium sp.]|uniref:hypothetical protein n=1 Tax=Clostridium sp. TaxID=1506 RepID=UPI003F3F9C17
MNNVIYEGNGIKVIFKGIKEEEFLGLGVKVLIENKTDRKILVNVEDLSVNDFMINGIFNSNIEAGKKANDKIILMYHELEENDIEEVENIEFKFSIKEGNTYMDEFETEIIRIDL